MTSRYNELLYDLKKNEAQWRSSTSTLCYPIQFKKLFELFPNKNKYNFDVLFTNVEGTD